MNKRITIRIHIYIYMLNICIPALSTNGWWFKPQGLETIIGNPPHLGTFRHRCSNLPASCALHEGGGSGVSTQNWRWGREPNVGAKVWKIAWEIRYYKGCVCVCVLLGIFAGFLLLHFEAFFFAKKDVGTLNTWVISYKGLTISRQFRIWVCKSIVEDITQMIWDGYNENATKSYNCQMLSWKVQPEGQVCGLRGRISPGPHSGPNVERCFPLKFLPPKGKKDGLPSIIF